MRCGNCNGEYENNYEKCPYCDSDSIYSISKGLINPKTYLIAFLIVAFLIIDCFVYAYDSTFGTILTVGIVIIIAVNYSIYRRFKLKFFKETDGYIVDFDIVNTDVDRPASYYAIISYKVNNKEYRRRIPVSYVTYMKRDSYINGNATVLYNPERPVDSVIRFSKEAKEVLLKDYRTSILYIVIAALVIILFIYFIAR